MTSNRIVRRRPMPKSSSVNRSRVQHTKREIEIWHVPLSPQSVPLRKRVVEWKSFHFLANVSDDDVYRMVPSVLWTSGERASGDCGVLGSARRRSPTVCACLEEMMTRKIFFMGSAKKKLLGDECMNTCQDLFGRAESASGRIRRLS